MCSLFFFFERDMGNLMHFLKSDIGICDRFYILTETHWTETEENVWLKTVYHTSRNQEHFLKENKLQIWGMFLIA